MLSPRAHRWLSLYGNAPGLALLWLGVMLTLAGVGWFPRRVWRWILAVTVMATHGNYSNFTC
jgi:hypothetical protein